MQLLRGYNIIPSSGSNGLIQSVQVDIFASNPRIELDIDPGQRSVFVDHFRNAGLSPSLLRKR